MFEPAAPVGGTSSMVVFYFPVVLVPCYPICHLLHTFGHLSFPCTPPPPPSPNSLGHHLRQMRGAYSASFHSTTNRSAASTIPRFHFPALFTAMDHSAVSTPTNKGKIYVYPLVVRNSLRSSTTHIFRLKLSARFMVLLTSHRAEHYTTG